jgi:2-dehydro-3-deoxyglucarate aldolase
MIKTLRNKFKSGDKIIGIMTQSLKNPVTIPLLNDSGIDFIMLDREHGSASFQDLENLAVAAKLSNISILVRVSTNNPNEISHVLDMGVDGIMVPHVETLEDVSTILNAAKYPPIGKRGYGMRKYLSKFYQGEDSQQYIGKANEHIVVIAQIESLKAIQNVENIVKDQNIDGVIIGPSDLSLDLGIFGKLNDELFIKNVTKVMDCCVKHKKSFGIHFSKFDLMLDWKGKGMNLLLYSSFESILEESIKDLVKKLK